MAVAGRGGRHSRKILTPSSPLPERRREPSGPSPLPDRGSLRRRLCLFLLCHLGGTELLLLLAILRQSLHVGGLVLLALHHPVAHFRAVAAPPLEHGRGNEALDLRRLLFLAGFPAHDELPHVVLLLEAEELPDVGGPLRAKTPRPLVVGEACN